MGLSNFTKPCYTLTVETTKGQVMEDELRTINFHVSVSERSMGKPLIYTSTGTRNISLPPR
jgi:hypothetical protein